MAVERHRVHLRRLADDDPHQEAVGGAAELPADQREALVVGQAHDVDVVLERAVPPLAAIERELVRLDDLAGRAVERDPLLPALAAHQDDRVLLDAQREGHAHRRLAVLDGAALGAVLDVEPLAAQGVQRAPVVVGLRRRRTRNEGKRGGDQEAEDDGR